MDKYFMWVHYERLHNHNKAKYNKTVCIFLGIYGMWCLALARLHPIRVYSPGFQVWVIQVLDIILFLLLTLLSVPYFATMITIITGTLCSWPFRLKSGCRPFETRCFVLCNYSLPVVFLSWTFFRILDWTQYHQTPWKMCIPNYEILKGNSRFSTDCSCSVWSIITCLLFVSSILVSWFSTTVGRYFWHSGKRTCNIVHDHNHFVLKL